MAIFLPYPRTSSMQENSRKNSSELRFLRQATEIGIFIISFRCRISDKEVIIEFHDYSTIITRVKYALFWPHFRLFFATVIMLVLCQC